MRKTERRIGWWVLGMVVLLGRASQAWGQGGDTEIAAGDAAWARRAEGHVGARALSGPIDAAIAAYERSVATNPDRLEATWKLLRALHFKGEFVARTQEEKQLIFKRGCALAESGLDRLTKRLARHENRSKLPPQQAALAFAAQGARADREGVPLHFWAGIHLELWAGGSGSFAAAQQGVYDRIRAHSEFVIYADKKYEAAGGHRLLGRLMTVAPKIPLFTWWVDRDLAVAELERAVALAPENPYNQVFLADALLQYQPERAAEARQILRREIARAPSPEQVVEDEAAIATAKALLKAYPR